MLVIKKEKEPEGLELGRERSNSELRKKKEARFSRRVVSSSMPRRGRKQSLELGEKKSLKKENVFLRRKHPPNRSYSRAGENHLLEAKKLDRISFSVEIL